MTSGISVIICCYNSANRILPTLEHLRFQKVLDNIKWELILVDNACTDGTVDMAEKFWDRNKTEIPLIIVYEVKPGLIYARKKGILAANFQYIVFCDDDNWLAQDYLLKAAEMLDKNPLYGIIGGNIEGVTEGAFPNWFEKFQSGYAVGNSFNSEKDVSKIGVPGAGMVIRKKICLDVFNDEIPMLCSGRIGGKLISGDDGEICMRSYLLGYKTLYSPNLQLKHYIDQKRLTITYRDDLFNNFSLTHNINENYRRLQKVTKLNYLRKLGLFTYCFAKYILSFLIRSEIMLRFSEPYLFFLSELKIFAKSDTKQILNFYKFTKKVN